MEVKVSGSSVKATIDDDIGWVKDRTINIEYGIDVDEVPDHIFNYMFGLLLSEQISWSDGMIVFEELTEKELRSIRAHVHINSYSDPYGRASEGVPRILTEKVANPDMNIGETDLVLSCNGMGKDGIASMLLANEINGSVQGFTVGNQYRNEKLYSERKEAMKGLCNTFSLPQQMYIETDFMKNVRYKIIPWWLFGLPLAYSLGSIDIIAATGLCYAKKHVTQSKLLRPNGSINSLCNISQTIPLNISSVMLPLSTYGCQKLLVERYPEALKYQRSCMHGLPWCLNCEDCYKTSLYLECNGLNPNEIGLLKSSNYSKKLRNKPCNDITKELGYNINRKLKNEDYDPKFEMMCLDWIPLTWRSEKTRKILEQHFESYRGSYGPYGDWVSKYV